MRTQTTQIRQRLGAKIKQRRKKLGMRTQDGLADKAGLSVSVISLAERGVKVDEQTLRLIELALKWPTNSTLEFLASGDDSLLEIEPQPPKQSSHYPADLQDDTERKLWDITDLDEQSRWRHIYSYRTERELARRILEGGRSSATDTPPARIPPLAELVRMPVSEAIRVRERVREINGDKAAATWWADYKAYLDRQSQGESEHRS